MAAASAAGTRRVVDGRGRHLRGGVDGRLHRPAAGADDRRVVGGQAVGARAVGHHDAHRAVGDRGRGGRRTPSCRGGRSWWSRRRWSSSAPRRRRSSSWSRRAVVGTSWSGRRSARRSRWDGSRPRPGSPRRRRRGPGRPPPGRPRANRTCLSAAARRPLRCPACPAPPPEASLSAGRAGDRGRGRCSLGRSARVAQSVEHFTCNEDVAGSIPASGSVRVLPGRVPGASRAVRRSRRERAGRRPCCRISRSSSCGATSSTWRWPSSSASPSRRWSRRSWPTSSRR